MKLRLSQEFGAQSGRQYHFDKDRVRIGRQPDNDIVFDANIDLDASGRHCELIFEQGAWTVVDLGSRNGTFVNGNRVQRHRLASQDVLECGKGGPRLRLDIPGAAPYAPPAQAPFAPMPLPEPGRGSTVAIPEMSLAGAPRAHGVAPVNNLVMGAPPVAAASPAVFGGAPAAPAPHPSPASAQSPASVGQAMASAIPQGATVGKRTVALMIDQAIAQTHKGRPSNTGLKVAVGLLTLVVLAGFSVGAWFIYDDMGARRDAPRRIEAPNAHDDASAGARIAVANENTVYLLAMERAGQPVHGFCSGFAVTRDLIATNAHCVNVMRSEMPRGAVIVALRNKSPGVRIQVTPAYADARFQNSQYSRGGSGYDIGLVRTAETLPNAVRLASDQDLYNLHEGDGLFVYGFPGLTMNERSPVATITLGLLNRETDFFDNAAPPERTQKFLHSAQTSGGSSGSPIFHPSGVVVGLNAGSLSDEERQTIYDPVSHQQREVEVNRGSNFKYGMRADLIRQAILSLHETPP